MTRRVLHIIPSVSAGGIESLVVSLYENIDRERFQFDFAVFNPNHPIHKEELENMGAKVYFIADAGTHSSVLSKIQWRIKALVNFYRLISNNKYDALHCHNMNFSLYILLATMKGIPIRIVHSHNAGSFRESWFYKKIRRFKNIVGFESLINHKVGCSDAAAIWLFGENSIANGRARTIYNGVALEKFVFPRSEKQQLREKYNLKKGTHFANVGRFSVQKNQLFLIDLFHQMKKAQDDIYLHIVGYGPMEQAIKDKVKELNLEDSVIFYKNDTSVPELLATMDYFLLPSNWEGLPITAIEAQASDLRTFISDTVTREVDMGLAVYLPIDKGAKYWADYILKAIAEDNCPRIKDPEREKMFNIKNVIKQYEKIYSQ